MRVDQLFRTLTGFVNMATSLDRSQREEAAREQAEVQQAVMAAAAASGQLGDGRLATLSDAATTGLLNPKGLFLGALNGRMLFWPMEGHVLTYARTGSGKGRDTILPNLAHLRDRSLVVVDVKDGENCFASHEHRAATLGQPCIYLNPFGLLGLPNTRINPFQLLKDVIARGGEIDTQADEIAYMLVSGKDEDWAKQGARRILSVHLEYLAMRDAENCNPGGLWRFVNSSSEELEASFQMMTSCGIEGIARRAAAEAATYFDAPKQFEAYKAEAIQALAAFEVGKSLERSTAAHDFDFGRLKHEPCTVYLITPSDKLSVAAPWITLVVNYAIETIARESGPVRTTFILDEFPQMPAAPAVMKALRLYRGKGIQLWIFSQGRYSMEGRWSKEAVKEFEDQASIFTMTGVEDPDLIRDLELWSGNVTIVTHGLNVGGGAVETAGSNRNEARRPVLQSEDIRGIGAGRQIIKVAGLPPLFVCERLPYYTVNPWKAQLRDVRDLHSGKA
jgi:type IV secretion system protein VirD4